MEKPEWTLWPTQYSYCCSHKASVYISTGILHLLTIVCTLLMLSPSCVCECIIHTHMCVCVIQVWLKNATKSKAHTLFSIFFWVPRKDIKISKLDLRNRVRAEQNEDSAGVPGTEKTGCWEGQVQKPEKEAVTGTQLSSGMELQILSRDDREDADDKSAGSERGCTGESGESTRTR